MAKAMEHATAGERGMARRIVRALIRSGHSISVCDGGEWTVSRSTSEREILNALATTGTDLLRVRNAQGWYVGFIEFIWGNDPDGSELPADYSDNDIIAPVISAAELPSWK